MTTNEKLAILVGGGPAPGINSVIGAATIRACLSGYEVLGLQDGFRWLIAGGTTHHPPPPPHPRDEPDPFPRRVARRDLAGQPDAGSEAARDGARRAPDARR